MRAVILAAGKGTRLGELTRTTPKPMIRIAGMPAVEHVMRGIQAAGIDDFILVTKHLSEQIEEYFGDGSRFGMRVRYVVQGDRYGTGAALLCARELASDAPLLMTFADVLMSACNYEGALDVYSGKWKAESGKPDATPASGLSTLHSPLSTSGVITLNTVPDPCTGADVELDDEGRVARIIEKPPPGSKPFFSNSSGLFVFDPVIFSYLERLEPSNRGEYEIPDAVNRMVEDGLAVYPYHLRGFWRDIGTVADIAAAEAELAREDRQRRSRSTKPDPDCARSTRRGSTST